MGSETTRGWFGVTSNAGRIRVTSGDTVTSSSSCQHANISDMLHPILTKLTHKNKCVNAHLWHDQFGVKIHKGVTEVKIVIFTKSAISPLDYSVCSCDSGTFISLIPLQNISAQISIWGWGHRDQKVIFTQNAISSDYTVWSCDSCICISSIPFTKVIGSNFNLGSQGSKGHFHQKYYNSSVLHSMTIGLIHVH